MRMRCAATILILAVPAAVHGQSSSAINSQFIPSITLEFKDSEPIPGAPAEMAWYTPIVCSPDGNPMVTIPGGPDARMPSFYALNPKGAITVAPGSAPGLY